MVVIIVGLLAFIAGNIVGRVIGAMIGWRRAMRMIRGFNNTQAERERIARASSEVLVDQHWEGCPVCDEGEPSATANTAA